MFILGIDIGSASSKAVILENGRRIVAAEVVPAGTGTSGPKRVIEQILEASGLRRDQISRVVATGYGRFTLEMADSQMSEIACHAKGIAHLVPGAGTIIDIGGQDAKAITIGPNGKVKRFFMNDKCAAGTGRFLDVLAKVMEVELSQLGDYDAESHSPAQISSTCVVFAESEVISQLSKGVSREDIIAGVHQSVASRACALALRAGITGEVVMSGGVAQNRGMVRAISKELSMPVTVAPSPQTAGALGAALYAYEQACDRAVGNVKVG